LDRHQHRSKTRVAMGEAVILQPTLPALGFVSGKRDILSAQRLPFRPVRVHKRRFNTLQFSVWEPVYAVFQTLPFLLNKLAEMLYAHSPNQDLDSRLEEVVTSPQLVVDAHYRVGVCEKVVPIQSFPQHGSKNRGTPKAASYSYAEYRMRLGFHNFEGQVVDLYQRAILRRACDRHLELARKKCELGMEGAPLAQQLAIWARVKNLIRSNACKGVTSDVAQTVSTGLNTMQTDLGQIGQGERHIVHFYPVELHVLSGREVAVASIVLAADRCKCAKTGAIQHSVCYGDAQHRCVALDIKAVLKAQRTQLIVAKQPLFVALNLPCKLAGPFLQTLGVELAREIHNIYTTKGTIGT